MEDTAPEAYIVRTLFGENRIQTRLVDLKPQHWHQSKQIGRDWQIQFCYRRPPQEIVAETNADNSSDNVVGKIVREEPETNPSDEDEQRIDRKQSDTRSCNG